MVLWDPEGTAWRWNRQAAELIGVEPRAMAGRSYDDERWGWSDDNGAPLEPDAHPVARTLASGEPLHGVMLGRGPGGDRRVFKCSTRPYHDDGRTAVVMTLSDPTRVPHATADLALRATTDALTGLPNRALLLDRLEQMLRRIRRSRDHQVTALYCDVDLFKRVNDELGHAAGDEVLYQLAHRLEAVVRDEDTVARFGGDEFIIACPDLEPDVAVATLAERVRRAASEPMTVETWEGSAEVSVSLSIGVAGSDPADVPLDLLRRADVAMYQAKEAGRDRVRIFDARLRRSASRRSHLETELAAAMETNEMVLHYQPVVELATRRVVGVEAQLRWEHPDRGLLLPEEFVVLAGQIGLIRKLGRWVIGRALDDLSRWRNDPALGAGDMFASVNLTGRQLAASDLAQDVSSFLEGRRLPPEALVVELSEDVFLDQPGSSVRNTQALGGLGVCLALDDFGAGLSPLGHLADLLAMVKIDADLVAGVARDPRCRQMVGALVALASALGLRTVGLGVTDDETAGMLAELGCQLGQGDHLGAPGPVSSVTALMAGGPRAPRTRVPGPTA